MAVVSMKQLLEAGVHPKMAPYIYMERNGIYIIDLAKTVKKLEEAYNFVRELSENGGTLLFVGTKKQAQDAMREEAERVGMYYVNARWLGGMLYRVAQGDLLSVDSSSFLIFLILNVLCLEFGIKKATVDRLFKRNSR